MTDTAFAAAAHIAVDEVLAADAEDDKMLPARAWKCAVVVGDNHEGKGGFGMTLPALHDAVSVGMRTRLTVNILRKAPHVSHEWIAELCDALSEDALAVIRELFEQPTAEMISAGVRAFYTGRRPMPEAITAAAKVLLGGTDGE